MRIDWDKYEVRPNVIGRSHGSRGYRRDPTWDLSLLEEYDLWFIFKGRGRFRAGGKWTPVRRGSCLWLRPGTSFGGNVEQEEDDPLCVHFLHFDLVDHHGQVRPPNAPLPPEHIESQHIELIEAVTRWLVDMAFGFGAHGYGRLPERGPKADIGRAMFKALLMELDRGSDTAAAPDASRRHERMIRDAAARIVENIQDPPSVEQLAADLGYGRHHFSRIFQRVTGLSPRAFTIEARTRRARQLITSTDLPIGKIAEIVGYHDHLFFSRQFRQQTGQTPTGLRGKTRK